MLKEFAGVTVLAGRLHDFSDTAAVTSLLDLVISVDTSVAHLAGALAKPLWLPLQFAADFRWLLDRRDSPWYPSARLFRQRRAGDWTYVLSEIRDGLKEYLKLRPETESRADEGALQVAPTPAS